MQKDLEIVCAAIKFIVDDDEEYVVACVRHLDLHNRKLLELIRKNHDIETILPEQQGFLDNYGNWWSREEAMKIMLVKFPHKKYIHKTKLFSEDLY